jgi:hypothetical protein
LYPTPARMVNREARIVNRLRALCCDDAPLIALFAHCSDTIDA